MALDGSSGQGSNPGVCPERRSFLFLQGPIGPFFPQLAYRLRAAGHGVHRINFNGGDRVVWMLPGAVNFRQPAADWPIFLDRCLHDWAITDVILFGDCRPLHAAAIDRLRDSPIAVHVFEEGYLRPNWVTLERGGVNNNSALPRRASWFSDAASRLPTWDEGRTIGRNFAWRALWDIVHNLSVLLLRWRYPQYHTHRPWSARDEYLAGTRRFFQRPKMLRGASVLSDQLRAQQQPYFMFPLQLEADTQIRFHSPFGGMAPAIRQVIESFARHAPADTLLVISEHPLDIGVVDQKRVVDQAAALAGVQARIIYLQGGSPMDLVEKARGLVTVNSTVGIQALGFGVPVKVLGDAIYDFAELTHQAALDRFWSQPEPPRAEIYRAFRHVIGAVTQLNGSFFCSRGRTLAVEAAVQRLLCQAMALPRVNDLVADLRRARALLPAANQAAALHGLEAAK